MYKTLFVSFIAISLLTLTGCATSSTTDQPLSDVDQLATIVAATLSSMPSPTVLPTATSAPTATPTPEPGSDMNWVSIYNPNLKITIQHPDNWTLSSSEGSFIRIDAPDKNEQNIPYTVQISQYNIPITSGESLLSWTEQYDRTSGFYDNPNNKILTRENLEIDGLEAVFTILEFPEVRYTNIQRDDTVLFIWSNIGNSAGDIYANIYKQIVMSFKSD